MKRKDCNSRFFSLCHLEGVLDWLVEWMKREDLQRVALMKTQEPSCQRNGFRNMITIFQQTWVTCHIKFSVILVFPFSDRMECIMDIGNWTLYKNVELVD